MTEIVTESFCERCGTRYTFEPVDTNRPLASLGTFGRGLRHFFTDPGSTLGESFAVARSETEQRVTNHALEAFHQTFNFCLSCRQYVCGECWNGVEGRCLSCAPVEAPEAAAAEAVLVVDAPAAPTAPMDQALPRIDVIGEEAASAAPVATPVQPSETPAASAPPTEPAHQEASLEAILGPLPEAPAERAATEQVGVPVPEAEPAVEEPEVEPEPVLPAETAPQPEQPVAVTGAPDAVDEALIDLQPGRSLDAEIAAYEELHAAPAAPKPQPKPEAEPVAAAAVEPEAVPEPVAAAEPEPVAEAAPEPELEPVAEAAPEPELEPVAEAAPEAVDAWPEPVATTPWHAAPPIGEDRIAAVAAPGSAPEEEPAQPAAATRSPLEFLPPIVGQRAASDAGRRQAPAVTGARACPSCGLSISINARFCRRCGTPQQQAG